LSSIQINYVGGSGGVLPLAVVTVHAATTETCVVDDGGGPNRRTLCRDQIVVIGSMMISEPEQDTHKEKRRHESSCHLCMKQVFQCPRHAP
jgi:hypothetical protein